MSDPGHIPDLPLQGEASRTSRNGDVGPDLEFTVSRTLRPLLERLTTAILILDHEQRVTYLSHEPDSLLAHTRSALLGKTLWEVFPEAIDSPLFSAYHQAFTTSLPVYHEVYYPPLDKWFEIHLMPSPEGWAVFVQDITQRKCTQEALSCIASIVESSEDAIFSKTLQGTILSWNGGAERLYGYCAQEMIGTPVSKLVPLDRLQELADLMHRLQQGECIAPFEMVRKRKDGSLIEVSLTLSPVKDAKSQLLGASAIARDISVRRRLQTRLRDSETRFRALIEHSADGIALVDHRGILLYASPSVVHLTGFTPEALLGTNGFDRVHPDDLPSMLDLFGSFLARPAMSRSVCLHYHHQDGSWRWMEGTATNLLAEPGVQAIVWNFRDITARKQAEENLLFGGQLWVESVEGQGSTFSFFLPFRAC